MKTYTEKQESWATKISESILSKLNPDSVLGKIHGKGVLSAGFWIANRDAGASVLETWAQVKAGRFNGYTAELPDNFDTVTHEVISTGKKLNDVIREGLTHTVQSRTYTVSEQLPGGWAQNSVYVVVVKVYGNGKPVFVPVCEVK